MLKLLIMGLVLYGVYLLFFRKNSVTEDDEKGDVKTVVACKECSLYVSIDEAVVKDGNYYCSKECAGVK